MTDQEHVKTALELWESFSAEEKYKLVNEWVSKGSLLEYIYEELHYTDDEGVEYEENMDYTDVEEIFLYRYWLPKIIKQLKGE